MALRAFWHSTVDMLLLVQNSSYKTQLYEKSTQTTQTYCQVAFLLMRQLGYCTLWLYHCCDSCDRLQPVDNRIHSWRSRSLKWQFHMVHVHWTAASNQSTAEMALVTVILCCCTCCSQSINQSINQSIINQEHILVAFDYWDKVPPSLLPPYKFPKQGLEWTPAEIEFGAFQTKNLAAGEHNFSDIPEEL